MDKNLTSRQGLHSQLVEILEAGIKILDDNHENQTKFSDGLINYCMEQQQRGLALTIYPDWDKTYKIFKKGNNTANTVFQPLHLNPSLSLDITQ